MDTPVYTPSARPIRHAPDVGRALDALDSMDAHLMRLKSLGDSIDIIAQQLPDQGQVSDAIMTLCDFVASEAERSAASLRQVRELLGLRQPEPKLAA